MKFALLILVACFLTACEGGYPDPYAQIAMANAQIASQKRAEVNARKTQAALEAKETQAAMEKREAAQDEIDLAIGWAAATQQALDIELAAIEAQSAGMLATQLAQDVRSTAIAVDATATAMAIEMSYQESKAAGEQERAEFWANLLPSVARIMIVTLAILAIVLVWWAGKRSSIDVQQRDQVLRRKEYSDRFYAARDGTFFLPEGETIPILVNQLQRIWALPSGDTGDEVLEDIPEVTQYAQVEQQTTDLRGRAIAMIDASVRANGDTEQLPGWRLIPGYSSEPWQTIVNYLVAVRLVEKRDGKYYAVTGTLEDVKYILQATSPTPQVVN